MWVRKKHLIRQKKEIYFLTAHVKREGAEKRDIQDDRLI